jgi:Lar family restriction alleviation protein
MEKLKPCPFCGSTDMEIAEWDHGWDHFCAVRCDCDCMMLDEPHQGQGWRKRADAIAAWNRRKADED